MNIVFFTRLFYPHIGGVEKHVFEVSKRLAERGHKIIIFTEEASRSEIGRNWQSEEDSARFLEKNENIQVHYLQVPPDSRTKKFHLWLALWKARSLFRETDIVHCHDVFFWYLPFRLLYPRKKVYTTFHGYEMKFPPDKKAIFIRKISELLSFGNICVGEYIRKWYGTTPTVVTYGGVDEKRYRKVSYTKNDSKPPKILLFGRLEEDNGADVYLSLLKGLKDQKIDYSLSVCGEGSYKKDFAPLGTLLRPLWDVTEYVQGADIVFSSSYLAILESLAAGKEVVSVYSNALKEDYLKLSPMANWIKIVNNDNKSNKVVQNIVLDSINTKKTQKSQNWASNQTWDRVVDQYLTLWA